MLLEQCAEEKPELVLAYAYGKPKESIELIDGTNAAIMAARAAEAEAALPMPVTTDRIKITGEVVSVKDDEGPYGFVTKLLVKSVDGWKVFGNAPSSASGVKRGDKVVFFAKVTVSNKDPKFGFFNRPTKFEIVTEEAN